MKKYNTIIILIMLPFLAKSQAIYDLKSCIEVGLKQNFDIQISRNNQKISDNNLTIGNAGYLPNLDLSAAYSGSLNDTKQYPKSGEVKKEDGVHNQLLNAGLALNWTLFDGFKIQTEYKRLQELKKMGELNTRLEIENLISNITSEYYNYIQQIIRLKNLKSAVKLSKERFRITEARYEIGAGSRLDMQQARVDFHSDSSRLIKQYEILHASGITLKKLMAIEDVDQIFLTTDSIIKFDEFINKEEVRSKMLTSNTFLLLSDKNRDLGILDLKTAQSENYPYLRVNAGYGYTRNIYNTGTIDKQDNLGFTYGLTLGFNLFTGFDRKRKQKNAKIEIENRELEYQQTKLSVEADFSNIWMAYNNNVELTNLERKNLITAQETHEIAIERYKLGDLAGIELREAQNSLLEAEERLLQAEYNTKLCEISLMQISGQILLYTE